MEPPSSQWTLNFPFLAVDVVSHPSNVTSENSCNRGQNPNNDPILQLSHLLPSCSVLCSAVVVYLAGVEIDS